MFLKGKSIILKAFLTCGSKFSSITFELHFDYIFCIFLQSLKLKIQAKNRQNTTRTSEKTAKKLGKNSAKVAKIKFCYGTDGSKAQV